MSSTFGALNTAASGLYAAQRGIDVTGQNVSNVNTTGYSRQRVDLQSVGASTVPALWSTSSGVGGGVNSDSVTRIRDSFLEGRAQTEHGNSAQLTAEDAAYTQVQQAFGEPGTTGISAQLTDTWSAWGDVHSSPGSATDTAARSALLTTTQTLVDGLHTASAALSSQWDQARTNASALVDDVNSAVGTIADLNQAIVRGTQSGTPVNELSDKRDALVMQLAEQIGATSSPGEAGAVSVSVGGLTLVSGSTTTKIALAGPTSMSGLSSTSTSPTTGTARIVSAVTSATVSVGGTAAGDLTAMNTIIPGYRSQLDGVAQSIATQVNAQQAEGYDVAGAAGTDMFTSATGTITAASITLAFTDPGKVAASSVGLDSAGKPQVNGGNADAMAQLGTATTSPDSTYRAMITQLGVQAASVSRSLDIQTTVTSQVDDDRESVSGVDIDEEMTNMLSYQHAYAAAGKLISAINDDLDVLMNMVGN